jgi:hypothetical protein
MKLKNILEMVTSASVGTNLIPQRWLGKMLTRPNLKYKDMTFYTSINQKKGKEKKNGRPRYNNSYSFQ